MLIDRLNKTADLWTPRGYTFICIYILEAHAVDEWPVSMTSRDVKQHKSVADRMIAAKDFLQDFPLSPHLPLYVDGEGDCFNTAYASWPFRFWAITQQKNSSLSNQAVESRVSLKPMPRNAEYDMGELDEWLQNDFDARHMIGKK